MGIIPTANTAAWPKSAFKPLTMPPVLLHNETLRIVAELMSTVDEVVLDPVLPSPRRDTGTRQRALAAATKILKDAGYSALTMERVAAESGVAKTTLYRRWSTKAALCMDLYLDVASRELHDPDTGRVEDDLLHIVNMVVHLQTRTVAGQAFVGVLAESQTNPATTSASLAEFAERRRKVTRKVLERAIARGEIRGDTDVDLVIDAIGGATTFRLLQGHAPLTRQFAKALVELVLNGCESKPHWRGDDGSGVHRSRRANYRQHHQ